MLIQSTVHSRNLAELQVRKALQILVSYTTIAENTGKKGNQLLILFLNLGETDKSFVRKLSFLSKRVQVLETVAGVIFRRTGFCLVRLSSGNSNGGVFGGARNS